MFRMPLRFLLISCCFLIVAPAHGQGDDVDLSKLNTPLPLDQLSTPILRALVRTFLDDFKKPAVVEVLVLERSVVLDPSKLVFELSSDKKTGTLTWTCLVRPGVGQTEPLEEPIERALKDRIRRNLRNAVGQYKPGKDDTGKVIMKEYLSTASTTELKIEVDLRPDPQGKQVAELQQQLSSLDSRMKQVEKVPVKELQERLGTLETRVKELEKRPPGGSTTLNIVYLYNPNYPWSALSTLGSAGFWQLVYPLPGATRQTAQRPPAKPVILPEYGPEDAVRFFSTGYSLYWSGNYADALAWFKAATALDPTDARSWCYQALTEHAQNDIEAAKSALARVAELRREKRITPQLYASLQRVQGADRRFLDPALRDE